MEGSRFLLVKTKKVREMKRLVSLLAFIILALNANAKINIQVIESGWEDNIGPLRSITLHRVENLYSISIFYRPKHWDTIQGVEIEIKQGNSSTIYNLSTEAETTSPHPTVFPVISVFFVHAHGAVSKKLVAKATQADEVWLSVELSKTSNIRIQIPEDCLEEWKQVLETEPSE